MTATMSKATTRSTVEDLIRLYYNKPYSHLSASKADVSHAAYKLGIRQGIAAILFLHRCDSLPRFKTVPMVYESDVNSILYKHEKDWLHSSGPEKGLVMDTMMEKLFELAVPADLMETDESERKRAVIEGREPALPQDANWLNEMIEAKRREIEEVVALLQPISKVNYPKQSDALLRCTRDDCAHLPEHRRSRHEYMMRSSQPAESEAAVSHVDD